MSIKDNTISLQNLLSIANTLPEAGSGGVELPTLSNEGAASDLLSGKQLIDGDGSVVTGTFTIDSELDTQDNLISQIQSALAGKSAGGVTLPTLSNPGTSDELMYGYELIDEDGNIVVGTHVCSGGSGEIYYTPVQNNIPEEYGGLMINGVICANNEITNIPFIDSFLMTFVFIPYDNSITFNLSYFEIEYEYDDGEGNISIETYPAYSNIVEDTGFIVGCFETMYEPFTINIVLNE